jgi:pilus assembly protein Flp/PilA
MRTMLLKWQCKVQQAKWNMDDKGATAVEYGLLVALISVVIIAAVVVIGQRLNANFQQVGNTLPNP